MEQTDLLLMTSFVKGRYRAAVAVSTAEVTEAQKLRAVCFGLAGQDIDEFDRACAHVLIRNLSDNRLVACFRMLAVSGTQIKTSYSAQFYDLTALTGFQGQMVELGRFCIHPDEQDPDILRIAWAAMTAYVDQNEVKLLFGCSSFPNADKIDYSDSFALLGHRHLAPACWLPKIKADNIVRFEIQKHNAKRAMIAMPPLLRTYLLMGGWVSDHAVVDYQLNTMHVFTGVEIDAIPATRKRLLRAVVG